MRKIILNILPYGILCLLTLLLIMIWWPLEGGWVALTNSWIALFFVCLFCAIFLFQEDIYHFLDRNIKSDFLGSTGPLQKHRDIPELFKDDQKFQEVIAGTVMAWMDQVNIEKQEQKLREEEISKTIELYKKEKKEKVKWLFLSADYLLVPHSKDVLYEIYERHYVTENMFQEMTAAMAIDEKEAEAILEVLKFLRFIRKQEDEIIITETGSAYCTYLERTNQR